MILEYNYYRQCVGHNPLLDNKQCIINNPNTYYDEYN
nr:MAG TPA: hypothetical protein [Herelleviridae sp.]DAR64511.1 MAG TPA: hypothetical protein [Caudoviricetes sp.]